METLQSFNITWNPTTSGTVTLVLLKGPSTNAVPQYAIAEKIENSGSYLWTPATNLAPTGNTGYGIELIVDSNGQYQYSTQFGISNAEYSSSSSSSSASSTSASASSSSGSTSKSATVSASASASVSVSASSTASASELTANVTASATGIVYTTEVVSKFTTYCPFATSVTMGNQTYTVSSATTLTITDCPCTITKPATASATAGPITASSGIVVASTGGIPANGSLVHATGSMTVPSSLQTSASAGFGSNAGNATGSSSAPIQTGAASGMATSFAGLVVAAGVAVLAL